MTGVIIILPPKKVVVIDLLLCVGNGIQAGCVSEKARQNSFKE